MEKHNITEMVRALCFQTCYSNDKEYSFYCYLLEVM